MTFLLQDTSGIVDPLSAINPLLGVIATITIFIVGFLVWEVRRLQQRNEKLVDDSKQDLKEYAATIGEFNLTLDKVLDRSDQTELRTAVDDVRHKVSEILIKVSQ